MTAASEGARVHTNAAGVQMGCDVGRLLRDDEAQHMLRSALHALDLDREEIVDAVTALALSAVREVAGGTEEVPGLQEEIARTERKKAAVLDSYFTGDITKEEMQAMKARYDSMLDAFRTRMRDTQAREAAVGEPQIRGEVAALLNGERESAVFTRHVVEGIKVFRDRHMELTLQHLPQVFRFE